MIPFDWQAILARVLIVVLAGGSVLAALFTEIAPVLTFLAGAGGGIVASKVFAAIRANVAIRVWCEESQATGGTLSRYASGIVAWLFYSPATAALVVALLGFLISGGASGLIAYTSGKTLDESIAVCVAFVASQLIYFLQHPAPDPRVPLVVPSID